MRLAVWLLTLCLPSLAGAAEITIRAYDSQGNFIVRDGERTLTITRAKIINNKVEVADDQGNTAEFEVYLLKALHIDALNFANEAVRNKSMHLYCKTESRGNICTRLDIVISKAAE